MRSRIRLSVEVDAASVAALGRLVDDLCNDARLRVGADAELTELRGAWLESDIEVQSS